jgi:hypothetical protein
MQFENLTPFDALCFDSIDTQDRECSSVVIKVGYNILVDADSGVATLSLKETEPSLLQMEDVYWGEPLVTSVRQESDVVPFKPACDVLVLGNAYAPEGKPAHAWPVRIQLLSKTENKTVSQSTHKINPLQPVLDKTLTIFQPGIFRRRLLGWTLEREKSATVVPLRWEQSFGGASQVRNPTFEQQPDQDEYLLNEVCFTNSLGCGWQHKGVNAAKQKTGLPIEDTQPAPCIFYPGEHLDKPVTIKHPRSIQSPADICAASKTYPYRPAGLGAIPRHWAPRIAHTGTYDDQWLNTRWPLLPKDFDEQFWNCAPQDQQIAWPSADCQINTWFLFSPSIAPKGYVELTLPGHRAFVMARLNNKSLLPLPAQIDTLILDTDALELTVTWRCRLIQSPLLAKLEARFEIDPTAPLLKWKERNPLPPIAVPTAPQEFSYA